MSATPTQPELRFSNKQLTTALGKRICIISTHVNFGVPAALLCPCEKPFDNYHALKSFADGNRRLTDIHEAVNYWSRWPLRLP